KGTDSAALYFRGLSIDATTGGEWRYAPRLEAQQLLPPNTTPPYVVDNSTEKSVTVSVHMIRPPAGGRAVFFYPGQLSSISRTSSLSQEVLPQPDLYDAGPPEPTAAVGGASAVVYTIDRATTLSASTAGSYNVTG